MFSSSSADRIRYLPCALRTAVHALAVVAILLLATGILAPGYSEACIFIAEHRYDVRGRHEQIAEVTQGFVVPKVLWQATSRDVDLQVSGVRFGNGIEVDWIRDPMTGRLQDVVRPEDALTYTYTPGGNIATRTAAGTAWRHETFDYDDLDRLTHWTLKVGISPLNHRDTGYGYDDLGNLLTVLEAGQLVDWYVPGGTAPPHAPGANVPTGAWYDYDALGRQTTAPGRAVTYTAFDLPRTLTTAAGTTLFDYDASGARVRKTGPTGETTITLGDIYERRQAGASVEHVFRVRGETGDVVEVVYDEPAQTEETLYLQADGHGSPWKVWEQAGNLVATSYFDPFGARVDVHGASVASSAWPGRRGFTGHDHDDELALVHMKGRAYDPALRRFLTPDPYVPEPLLGQSYNRYAYVLNNPLRYVDPTGFAGDAASDYTPSGNALWFLGWAVDQMVGWGGGGNKGSGGHGQASGSDQAQTPQLVGTLAPASSSGTESGQAATPDGSADGEVVVGTPQRFTFEGVTVEVVTIALSPTTVLSDLVFDGYENAQAWNEVSKADREDMLSKLATASTGTVLIVVSVLPWGKGVGKAAKVGRGRIVKTILRVVGQEAKPAAREAPKLLNAVPKSVFNTANHIFGPKSLTKHNLGPVLEAFGGDKVAATYALQNAAQALANRGAIKGVFDTTVQVAGHNVTIRGAVIEGIANLRTAFIPIL